MNITTCDFTIAFWVKYIGVDGPILALWSKDGKLFYVTVKNSRLILSIHNTFHLQINYWNHVAVTCQQHKIKVFVNGTEEALIDQWNEYFFSLLGRYQPEYIIGNDPGLVQMPMANGVFVGAVMDLYVTGIALSGRQVYDLSKGESSIYSRLGRIPRLQSQILNRGLLDVKIRDVGDLSDLIGSLSRTIQQYSPPSEWIMCELGFFPIFLEKDLLKVDKILGLTFF